MTVAGRIIEIIVPVFFIVAVGFLYARRFRPDMTWFSRIALDVCTPMLTYSALASRNFEIAQHAALLAAGALLSRQSPRTLVPVVMFNNCGNMGLPLALLAFGPQHIGAAVALFSISNLIHFSIGARITSRDARTRDLLLSPMMLATVLGFASALTEVRPPAVLLTGMKLMGDASLPLMLFALGVRLSAFEPKGLLGSLLGAVARPVIGMALALPLAQALELDALARAQLLLFAALPPAVLQFMLADRYRQEPEKVAGMIMLGNVLALLFVPLGLTLGMG